MIPLSVPAQQAQPPSLPPTAVRAQFAWSYEASDANGSGTMSLLMDAAGERLVLEIHSFGDRLALLTGDAASGYHLQVPKEKIDRTEPGLAQLPLPFLPEARTVAALRKALETGEGPGLEVLKRKDGVPVKLRYKGVDEKGQVVLVWLSRKRWEPVAPAPGATAPRP